MGLVTASPSITRMSWELLKGRTPGIPHDPYGGDMKHLCAWWARQTAQEQHLGFQEPWVERDTKLLVGEGVAPFCLSASLYKHLRGMTGMAEQRAAWICNGKPQGSEGVSANIAKERQ